MSHHRFFLERPLAHSDGRVILPLSEADAHHLRDVLRVCAGETVEVVDPGSGVCWRARVEEVGEHVDASLVGEAPGVRLPFVTLVQGLAKGEKMDTIIRQAVEAGASEVIPVSFKRSIVKLEPHKAAARTDRWNRIAVSAAKQSHRASVPAVREPTDLGAAIDLLASHDLVLVCWEEENSARLVETLLAFETGSAPAKVAVVVGPEGGIDASEVSALTERGAKVVALGDTVLRTETAAVVAVAVTVQTLQHIGVV